MIAAASPQQVLDIYAQQSLMPGGRLTTETGVPISTSDRTSQSSLYYTPYLHNVITLWDGVKWVPTVFAETLVTGATLTGLTSGKPYDVFAYLSGGVLALELLAWTNDTTRATAVTIQDGRYCKSGDKTRMLVGTIYTTGTTTTEDSLAKRLVNNLYNTVPRRQYDLGSGTQNTTSASYAEFNVSGDKARIDAVVCNPGGVSVVATLNVAALSTVTGDVMRVAISHDGSTGFSAFDLFCQSSSYQRFAMALPVTLATGLVYGTTLFQRLSGTGTATLANPQANWVLPC